MLVVLCILAVVAIHRIWHYEAICASARRLIPMDPALTPLPISIVVGAATVSNPPWVLPVLTGLACYPVLRLAVWAYLKFDPPPPETECVPCKERDKKIKAMSEALRSWERRIVLFGWTTAEVEKLAEQWPKTIWVMATTIGAEHIKPQYSNMMYHPIIDAANDQGTLNNLMYTVMAGGNATIITMHEDIHLPRWKTMLNMIRHMRALSWIHVTAVRPPVPAHHVVVAPDQPLDTVLSA